MLLFRRSVRTLTVIIRINPTVMIRRSSALVDTANTSRVRTLARLIPLRIPMNRVRSRCWSRLRSRLSALLNLVIVRSRQSRMIRYILRATRRSTVYSRTRQNRLVTRHLSSTDRSSLLVRRQKQRARSTKIAVSATASTTFLLRCPVILTKRSPVKFLSCLITTRQLLYSAVALTFLLRSLPFGAKVIVLGAFEVRTLIR